MAELGVESRCFDPKHRLTSREFPDEEMEARTEKGTSAASTCSKGRKIMKILLVCQRQKRRAPKGPWAVPLSCHDGEGRKEGREGRKAGPGPALPPPSLCPNLQHSSDELDSGPQGF